MKSNVNALRKVPLISSNNASVTEQSAGLYDAVVNAEKDSVVSYQNIPSSKNGIMSWAFGNDFKLRSPCTRCQRLYSGWVLHEMPDTPGKKLAGLVQDHRSGSLKYSSAYKYPCNYSISETLYLHSQKTFLTTYTLAASGSEESCRHYRRISYAVFV